VEPSRASYEGLRARLDEAIALVEACGEQTLLDALRKLTSSHANPLRVYVLGEELVVAAEANSLVAVNLREGRVRSWDDWRDRMMSAARAVADEVAKKLLTLILDRGEAVPPSLRSEMSRVVTSISASSDEEFKRLLVELRDWLGQLVR